MGAMADPPPVYLGWLLFVQPPVPPPAPPVPPPAAPVPPPAPEPEPLAPPLVPVPVLVPVLVPEPVPPDVLPPEGAPGVLFGGMVVLVGPPDLVPVASAPSLAAKLAAEAVANRPASNNEVNLRVIMIRLQKGDVPDIGLARRRLGAGRLTSGQRHGVGAQAQAGADVVHACGHSQRCNSRALSARAALFCSPMAGR